MFAELRSATRRVAKPVRRYLAHTRADKAALLCGPAFCARIPPGFRPALPPPPPSSSHGSMELHVQFCLYSAIAVTMQLLFSLYAHISPMALQRDGCGHGLARVFERS